MSTLARKRIHCLRPLIDPSEARAAVTAAIVRLLRARTGSRPAAAVTEMSSDLALVTVSENDGYDPSLYEGIRDAAIAAVEAVTGRRVVAYLTAQQQDPELALIAFHFEPPTRLSR